MPRAALATWSLICAVSACSGEPPADSPRAEAQVAVVATSDLPPTKDPLRVACDDGDAARCTRLSEERRLNLPLVAKAACEGQHPAHTLAMSVAGIDLDGMHHENVATAGAALAAANHEGRPLEIALMFAGSMRLAELRPLLAELVRLEPRPRLFVSVESYLDVASPLPPSSTQHLPIAGIELGVEPSPPPDAGYRLRFDGHVAELTDLVDPDRVMPSEGALTGASLRVEATDETTWWTIATGLARACEGARLVEPTPGLGPIGRRYPQRPTGTVTAAKDRPTDPDAPGHLEWGAVRRRARADHSKLQKCYEGAPRELKGRVRVRFLVAESGAIVSVDVVETTLDAATTRCLVVTARGWTFPPPEGGRARATYTFYLNSD